MDVFQLTAVYKENVIRNSSNKFHSHYIVTILFQRAEFCKEFKEILTQVIYLKFQVIKKIKKNYIKIKIADKITRL